MAGSRWVWPAASGADRALDLLGAGVLGEVAAGAGPQGGEERVVVGVGGEHQRLGSPGARRGSGGLLRAVHRGHAQVHEHDVGVQVACELRGLDAVGGCADDLDAVE